MARRDTPSSRSAELARRDRAALQAGLATAAGLGAVTGDTPTGADEPAAPDEAGFDAALDLPLGIEPVALRPRPLILKETDPDNDVLPAGVVAKAAITAATQAARECGYPMAATGYWISSQRHGRSPVHFDDPTNTNPPSRIPPFVRADLSGGDTRDAIRAGLVRAVTKAARSRRRPDELPGFFVDGQRATRWDELCSQPRRSKGLYDRLRAAADTGNGNGMEHVGRWFCDMAHPVHLEAYDSGVPVIISGTASTESGFQAIWHIADEAHSRPGINLTASAYSLHDTIRHVIELVLFAHAVNADTETGETLTRAMLAAVASRLTPVPPMRV